MTTNDPFPLSVLLVGVILQAVSVTLFATRLLSDREKQVSSGFYFTFVLILSFSLAFTRLSRFAGFSGFDAVQEATVSIGTYSSNYWDPTLGLYSNYQSSLAITILPSILGRALEIPSNIALLFQDFLLMAMLPLAVQTVTTRLTASARLGAFSGLLIATNWFFFGEHLIGKTELALLLCTLSIYCLSRKESDLQSLGVLLGFGVVMSHYTIGLYYASILLMLLAWSKILVKIFKRLPIFKNSAIPPFGTWRPLAAVGLVFLWILYAAPLVLPTLQSSANLALSALTTNAGQKNADTSLFLSSTAGVVITAWFDFQNGLLALGGLLALNRYRRGRILGSLANWTVAGIVLLAMPLAWVILPGLSLQVESTRVIEMILPFSILLMAWLLVRVHAFGGLIWKGAVLLLVFLLVPMNLMLLNPQEIIYHQANTLPLDKRLDLDSSYLPTASNTAVASWVNSYVPSNKPLEVDSVSLYALATSLPFPSNIIPAKEDFPPYGFNRYVVLSFYFVNDNTWSKSSLGTRILIIEPAAPFFESSRDIVYGSPRFWVATPSS